MKYKFRLTLQRIPETTTLVAQSHLIETIEASSLVQLVLQFSMLIIKLEREMHDEELNELRFKQKGFNDDIPF